MMDILHTTIKPLEISGTKEFIEEKFKIKINGESQRED